jgi:hypothetical protein
MMGIILFIENSPSYYETVNFIVVSISRIKIRTSHDRFDNEFIVAKIHN